MMIIHCEQATKEWFDMRCGCITSSRLNDVLAKLKTRPQDEAAARANYRKQLVIERLTGNAAQHYVSDPMLWGVENEPLARAAYEDLSGNEVEPIGLAMHEKIKWFSASTDGLIGKSGSLEIKCLNSTNHLDVLIAEEIPKEYHWQMLGGMACADREWCDFVSFDPRMPEGLKLFVKRLERSEALISGMEMEVEQFLLEVDATLARLKERCLLKSVAVPV